MKAPNITQDEWDSALSAAFHAPEAPRLLMSQSKRLGEALAKGLDLYAQEYSCDYITDPDIHIDPAEWKEWITEAHAALLAAGWREVEE